MGLRAVYGSHAAFTELRELNYLSHCRRLPGTGLQSSLLSLELMMDLEDKIEIDAFPNGERLYFLLRLNRMDCRDCSVVNPVNNTRDRLGVHYAAEKLHSP